MDGHVIVCGLGHVGSATVGVLRQLDIDVVVVDRSPDPALLADAEQAGARVIQCDMRDRSALLDAGIDRARAVVVTTSDDVANVDILFRVQRLSPNLRVVFRLADDRLSKQLQAALPSAIGLTVPEMASPAFAFAVGSSAVSRALVVQNSHWAVADVDPRRSPLHLDRPDSPVLLEARGPFGSIALPVAIPPDATEVTIAGPWERVLGALGAHRPWPDWHPGLFLRLAAAARSVRPALWVVAALAFVALTINAIYFMLLLNISIFDAIYFVTTTLTTVGYGDISLLKESGGVKLYASALMLLGTLMTAVLTALVTEHVIGQRLESVLGARPLPRHGHVVVIGLGTVGFRAVTELRRLGAPVAVIDQRPSGSLAQRVRAMGVPVLAGDGSSPATLDAARVDRASCVLVVTSDDMTNLGVALTVRERRSDQHVVLRLFDHELAARVRTAMTIPTTLSTSELAAPAIAAHAAFGPQALDTVTLGGAPYVVWTHTISSAEASKSLGDLVPADARALLLHSLRGDRVLPPATERLETGDLVVTLRPAATILPAPLVEGSAHGARSV